jgi:protoporphyrinogen oxidase
MKIPGIIEYTNLNPLKDKVVYFPFYLHRSHENFSKPDDFFYKLISRYCQKINPRFEKSWILGKAIHRYEYAQPVCPPKFLTILPPISVGIKGLYIADTSHYYPEDRSISESIRIGEKIASIVLRKKEDNP